MRCAVCHFVPPRAAMSCCALWCNAGCCRAPLAGSHCLLATGDELASGCRLQAATGYGPNGSCSICSIRTCLIHVYISPTHSGVWDPGHGWPRKLAGRRGKAMDYAPFPVPNPPTLISTHTFLDSPRAPVPPPPHSIPCICLSCNAVSHVLQTGRVGGIRGHGMPWPTGSASPSA